MLYKIKLIFSIVLLVCIFLPLAQCSSSVKEGHVGERPMVNQYIFNDAFDSESVIAVISWVLPFLLVLLGLKFGVGIKLLAAQVGAIFFSAFSGLGVIIWSHHLLWPAYLAAVAMLIYLLVIVIELGLLFRAWRLAKA